MKMLIQISSGDLPVVWKRPSGSRHRFKNDDLRAWQESIATLAREEIELTGKDPSFFPYDGQVYIHVHIMYPNEAEIVRTGDPDNIEKGLFDALTGVLIKDDKVRYIRKHTTEVSVAKSEETVGTHVTIYSL